VYHMNTNWQGYFSQNILSLKLLNGFGWNLVLGTFKHAPKLVFVHMIPTKCSTYFTWSPYRISFPAKNGPAYKKLVYGIKYRYHYIRSIEHFLMWRSVLWKLSGMSDFVLYGSCTIQSSRKTTLYMTLWEHNEKCRYVTIFEPCFNVSVFKETDLQGKANLHIFAV
jgi:hypothetical protein